MSHERVSSGRWVVEELPSCRAGPARLISARASCQEPHDPQNLEPSEPHLKPIAQEAQSAPQRARKQHRRSKTDALHTPNKLTHGVDNLYRNTPSSVGDATRQQGTAHGSTQTLRVEGFNSPQKQETPGQQGLGCDGRSYQIRGLWLTEDEAGHLRVGLIVQQPVERVVGGFDLRPVLLDSVDVQGQARDRLRQDPHARIHRSHLHRASFGDRPSGAGGPEQEAVARRQLVVRHLPGISAA